MVNHGVQQNGGFTHELLGPITAASHTNCKGLSAPLLRLFILPNVRERLIISPHPLFIHLERLLFEIVHLPECPQAAKHFRRDHFIRGDPVGLHPGVLEQLRSRQAPLDISAEHSLDTIL